MRTRGTYKRIAILIMRKRKNRLTAEEEAELDIWTRNEKNRTLLNELMDDNVIAGKLNDENNLDVAEEFKIIQKRITRSKSVSRIGIIVLACIIIAACLIVYLTPAWIVYIIEIFDI